ncbi:MAG TPA: lipopolysaccharide heptosyltransferase II [Phycisphaerales bacterium]|nr:MAG: lipopolysaccharide heptosyltransferase II [Planctomycetes bacterium GWC2_45_44]HBG77390.1 lipopolysaccharide heptosyltransferase II [Phycisphaerales bacterium]HBR19583.1 lipopolysaccharide heptosyltransferase II [Phycisphaerales bacterium]
MGIKNILVWLPSPMGDAIMATPALRSIRERFADAKIYFCASKTVADALSPTSFADEWIVLKKNNPFVIAAELKKYDFDAAILLKNSFASAMAVFLAGIKSRIGYAREARGFLLTEKLYPQKKTFFEYKPIPVIDYYLAIAAKLGGETTNKKTQLDIAKNARETIGEKFSNHLNRSKPVVIIVPGGAFGPSKIWPEERFAAVIDFLVEKFSANVFISVSPAVQERRIAQKICSLAKHPAVNLADTPIMLGQLKALFYFSDLVISNDTGPRHIAIALGKKIITLFGPNNPAWTQSDYADEIKIVADVPCAPCDKPVCKKDEHFCMQSITAENVCAAAEKILSGWCR